MTDRRAELAWRLAVWAIIGFSAAVCDGEADLDQLDRAVVALLGIVGMDAAEAVEVASPLPGPEPDEPHTNPVSDP